MKLFILQMSMLTTLSKVYFTWKQQTGKYYDYCFIFFLKILEFPKTHVFMRRGLEQANDSLKNVTVL